MAISKKKFREIVFQLLYSHDLSGASEKEMVPLMMAELSVAKSVMRDAYGRMQEVQGHEKELDRLIEDNCEAYDLERVGRVERGILRLGTYELVMDGGVPPKVAIVEAMRLAKKFSSPESVSFVNAVMDRIRVAEGIEVEAVEEDKHETFFED